MWVYFEVVWIVYVVNMAAKAKKESSRYRNWSEDEMCIFVQVHADPDNGFANGLEMLALKPSSNKETVRVDQEKNITKIITTKTIRKAKY